MAHPPGYHSLWALSVTAGVATTLLVLMGTESRWAPGTRPPNLVDCGLVREVTSPSNSSHLLETSLGVAAWGSGADELPLEGVDQLGEMAGDSLLRLGWIPGMKFALFGTWRLNGGSYSMDPRASHLNPARVARVPGWDA